MCSSNPNQTVYKNTLVLQLTCQYSDDTYKDFSVLQVRHKKQEKSNHVSNIFLISFRLMLSNVQACFGCINTGTAQRWTLPCKYAQCKSRCWRLHAELGSYSSALSPTISKDCLFGCSFISFSPSSRMTCSLFTFDYLFLNYMLKITDTNLENILKLQFSLKYFEKTQSTRERTRSLTAEYAAIKIPIILLYFLFHRHTDQLNTWRMKLV